MIGAETGTVVKERQPIRLLHIPLHIGILIILTEGYDGKEYIDNKLSASVYLAIVNICNWCNL